MRASWEPMPDVRARLLLTAVAALVAFAVGGLLLSRGGAQTPVPTDSPGPTPTIPDFALIPAIPAAIDPARAPNTTSPSLTIVLGGDVHGEPPIEELLLAGDNPLDALADQLQAADIAMVNLETAVGTSGTPADKTYTFQADPSLAAALVEVGIDVVTLANNHALDFGTEAAAETRQNAEDAGLAVIGHGEDREQAYQPYIVEVEGRSVAFIGLSRVFPVIEWAATDDRPGLASAYDRHLEWALQAVRAASHDADHVVVAVHWGRERWACPDEAQVALATALTAAGADVIAGHHPHVLQGVVQEDDALVAYSLGNLLFYARTQATRQSGLLTVTLGPDGVQDHAWTPAAIDDLGRPQPAASQVLITEGEQLTVSSSGPQCGPPMATFADDS